MDPVTSIATGLAVLGSKDLLNKVLGPTAEYFGGEAKNLVDRCNINLDRVFQVALRKLGKRGDTPGVVNPRVLKEIINEGSFCDDPLVSEYLGGVLASSKTDAARDDRAVSYLNILASLSTYQIRTHYLIYSALFLLPDLKADDIRYWIRNDMVTLFVSDEEYLNAMAFTDEEDQEALSRHAFLGLEMKRLSEGGLDVVREDTSDGLHAPFRYFYPTRYGIELFLWGIGLGGLSLDACFENDLTDHLLPGLHLKPLKFCYNKIRYS